jgi:hypothetical protein
MRMASAKRLKALNGSEGRRVEKHHSGEMEPPSPLETSDSMAHDSDGERGRNRTYNLLIKSQLLCQLSYAPDAGINERMPAPQRLARANFSIVALRARKPSSPLSRVPIRTMSNF